jgi:hypothetical protein
LRAAVLALVLIAALTAMVSAQVWTDQEDYSPGSVVTISGDNSDGAGYLPGETVVVAVSGPNDYAASCEAVAGEFGAWSCQVTLWADETAVGDYSYTATGRLSGVSEISHFKDGLSQHTCALMANGSVKCWGSNPAGQLGDGTTTTRFMPVDVSGLTGGIVQISGGYQHTCALTGAGSV